MIGSLPLGFAQPLVLIGLLSLPVLWWLLRLHTQMGAGPAGGIGRSTAAYAGRLA